MPSLLRPDPTPAGAPDPFAGGREAAQREVVLRTTGLTKRFRRKVAVDGLDLEVYRGETFALLGPNGSGKTTTLGLVLGLLRPTAGKVEMLGGRVPQDLPAVLRRVGAIVEIPTFYPHLSGRDNLRAFAWTLGVADAAGRVQEALATVGLEDRARDKFHTYSLGMKQRLGIAAALLNDPELLVLDEPTNGVDPAGMVQIRELIRTLGRGGKTIILASHLLHEVEQVADRVAILNRGRLIHQGRLADFRRAHPGILLRTPDLDRARAALQRIPWVQGIDQIVEDGRTTLVVTAPAQRSYDLSAALGQQGIYLSELRVREATLEEVFLDLTVDPPA
jgi:ABC-2 type transport system ATP-binding protein